MDGFTSSLGNESPFGHKFWQSSHSELFMWDPWKFIIIKFALSGILNVSWLSVPHKYDACTYGHWAWIYAWVCWQCVCVCVCVFITEAPMVVLCLQFCVRMKVEGLSSNFFHILLKVYRHSCCCCSYQPHIFTVGSLCKVTTPFARMVLNILLSFTVSKQDPTLLYGWNLCS